MTTLERLEQPGWWPTKGTYGLAEYAGPQSCSRCHAGIAATQRQTAMFKALTLASDSPVLKQHPEMRFEDDRYHYLLARTPRRTTMTVDDGTRAITADVGWAFGAGSQTFVLRNNNFYLESRLSYFEDVKGLRITPAHAAAAPQPMEAAFGDGLNTAIVQRCFGCHSAASTVTEGLNIDHAYLGVTCEACHGPGAGHARAMSKGRGKEDVDSFDPGALSPVDSVDFCGACHRTAADVVRYLPQHMGIPVIRMQPYRLERSLCWGTEGDARITCVACHNPHKPLVRDPAAYDVNCLACHANGVAAQTAKVGRACPVATKNCVTCHMKKYSIPSTPLTYTDHYIRIVRDGEVFPD
jgi:hypothetical protein